jgi:predicted AlkP superfamily pyrophosphatase or phosphodiesterase
MWRCAAILAALAAVQAMAAERPRPKLVVGIVIDQFRYDYLTRYRSDYTGGFDRLLRRGAVYTNARYQHLPTVTAVGHATFMTGAPPARSGIVGNDWYDRELRRTVTNVSDPAEKSLGAGGVGASPRRLVASTLGDEMKMAWRGKPRVIGVSLKDRAAILPSGHMADAAYWFDSKSGGFVSSTFYFPDLPGWVKEYNATRPAARFAGVEWKPLAPNPDFPNFSHKLPAADDPKFYGEVGPTPFGNDLIVEFVERLLDRERLGQRETTDLLTVSFSSNDSVGHRYGPDSPEARDTAIRGDRLLAKLLDAIDARLGPDSTLVALTGDHGVMPMAEQLAEWKMPGGRVPSKAIAAAVESALQAKFGKHEKWVEHTSGLILYLNRAAIARRKLRQDDVEAAAAEAAAGVPHVFRVYTRTQLVNGAGPDDRITRAVERGFYPSRSGDLFVLLEPYWLNTHVPVIFMGPGIEPGRYDREILPNDIAPTLATLLEVETPSGSIGQALEEVMRGYRGVSR